MRTNFNNLSNRLIIFGALSGTVGLAALSGCQGPSSGGEAPRDSMSPTLDSCNGLPAVHKALGGFSYSENCVAATYDANNPYSTAGDAASPDIQPGQFFDITCVRLGDKPAHARVVVNGVASAINLSVGAQQSLPAYNLPQCPTAVEF